MYHESFFDKVLPAIGLASMDVATSNLTIQRQHLPDISRAVARSDRPLLCLARSEGPYKMRSRCPIVQTSQATPEVFRFEVVGLVSQLVIVLQAWG